MLFIQIVIGLVVVAIISNVLRGFIVQHIQDRKERALYKKTETEYNSLSEEEKDRLTKENEKNGPTWNTADLP